MEKQTQEQPIEWPIISIPISGLLLADLVRGAYTYQLNSDIPADAQLIGMTLDPSTNTICLFFRHESFPLCVDGEMPSMRHVALTRIDRLPGQR